MFIEWLTCSGRPENPLLRLGDAIIPWRKAVLPRGHHLRCREGETEQPSRSVPGNGVSDPLSSTLLSNLILGKTYVKKDIRAMACNLIARASILLANYNIYIYSYNYLYIYILGLSYFL